MLISKALVSLSNLKMKLCSPLKISNLPTRNHFKGSTSLPLKEEELLDDEIFLMDGCEKEEKKIRKIHQVLAHPLSEILKKFIRNSSENYPEVLRLVDKVNNKCDVCKLFRKSPSRPKAGLPVSSGFNECVALDLKERRSNK